MLHLLTHRCSYRILADSFDAGEYFEFVENEVEEVNDEEDADNGEDESFSTIDSIVSSNKTKYSLAATVDIAASNDVFLVDHMWTTTFPQTRRHLSEIPGLLDRIGLFLPRHDL